MHRVSDLIHCLLYFFKNVSVEKSLRGADRETSLKRLEHQLYWNWHFELVVHFLMEPEQFRVWDHVELRSDVLGNFGNRLASLRWEDVFNLNDFQKWSWPYALVNCVAWLSLFREVLHDMWPLLWRLNQRVEFFWGYEFPNRVPITVLANWHCCRFIASLSCSQCNLYHLVRLVCFQLKFARLGTYNMSALKNSQWHFETDRFGETLRKTKQKPFELISHYCWNSRN